MRISSNTPVWYFVYMSTLIHNLGGIMTEQNLSKEQQLDKILDFIKSYDEWSKYVQFPRTLKESLEKKASELIIEIFQL